MKNGSWYFMCIAYMQADQQMPMYIQKMLNSDQSILAGQQKITVCNDDPTLCSLKKIVAYMVLAHEDEVRLAFAATDLRVKCALLKKMDIHEYSLFLFAFSEEQWKDMWQKLSEDERKIIPPTKLEQLALIRDVWLECSSGRVGQVANGKRDALVSDLMFWRNRALKSVTRVEIVQPQPIKTEHRISFFYTWLNDRFDIKKRVLLKEFGV